MKQVAPVLIAIAILFAAVQMASPFGLGKEGSRGGFGSLGSSGATTAAVVIPSCSGTGLDFTASCNSQYIGTL